MLNEIKKTFEIFKSERVIEVRTVGKKVRSGYFSACEKAAEHVMKYPNETWYFVLNKINSGCHSRTQSEQILENPKETTADHDIERREWILIDADPIRTSGVSSTDEEKEFAHKTIGKIYNYLRDAGFAKPVVCDSGNGYHLLYRIDLLNKSENTDLIKQFLETLDILFSDERVSVDKSVFNASRITKLYGSWAKKGSNTVERPHRLSKIIHIPDDIKLTSVDLIRKIAESLPKPEKQTYRNNYANTFDLRDFMTKHGISISKETQSKDAEKFVLDECVFDPNHKAPDAAIFQLANGAIAYKCFHSSCADKTWQDVRQLYEPQCYERKYEAAQHRDTKPVTGYAGYVPPDENNSSPEQENTDPRFLKMSDIKAVDRSKIVTVKTGVRMLDTKIGGANKGELSIWSGGNGSGKSTVLSQIALDSVQAGFNVAMFSGELTAHRVKNWLYLQAAGRQYTEHVGISDAFYTPQEYVAPIDNWLSDKLWLYNNYYGTEVNSLLNDFENHIKDHQTDVVIIDNLMVLDTTKYTGSDKYEKQTTLVKTLSDMAKRYNAHIHFVCHPRKPAGFLRKDDISGTADITNIADNVFICHRVNRDFERQATQFLGEKKVKNFIELRYTNIIEVCKNRDLGIIDHFAGMYFEIESKRLLNEQHENKLYNWQESLKNNWQKVESLEEIF